MWYGNQLINNFWQLKVGSLEKKIVKRIIPIAQISLMHDFHARNPPPEFFGGPPPPHPFTSFPSCHKSLLLCLHQNPYRCNQS